MTRMHSITRARAGRCTAALLTALAAAGCAPGDEPLAPGEEPAPPIGTLEQGLIGGVLTDARREVGMFLPASGGYCSATLIAPRFFVTAAHCADYGNPLGGTLRLGGRDFPVKITMSFDGDPAGPGNNGVGAMDVALGQLGAPVPPEVAKPARLGWQRPAVGDEVTVFGYGCTSRVTRAAGGRKRALTFGWGDSAALCPGDSGGPVFLGSRLGEGALVAINSGHRGNGKDIFARVDLFKERIEQTIRDIVGFEEGMSRPGGDYHAVQLDGGDGDGARCRDLCAADERCRAFTYDSRSAECALKERVGDAVPAAGSVSGLAATREPQRLRGGEVYRETDEASAEACESRCAMEGRCESYAWHEASQRCMLKDQVAPGRRCVGCVSGARRAMELGVDRPGSDLRVVEAVASPAACADACAVEELCRAWSYDTSSAACALKDAVAPPVASAVGISGVRRGFEYNVERSGGDYHDFAVASPDPALCQAACERDGACKAWTMSTEPTGQGNRCWLKNRVSDGRRVMGMISGRRGMAKF